MAVIWGLNLNEIQWNKFKSSYMWNNTYHLRRTKFIVYQCAMILCVFSESFGTAALSDYVDEQNYLQKQNNSAYEYNNDYIGTASFNIFAGVFVATIFGAAFFFDLFWPERHESKQVRLAWKICAVFSCILSFASGMAMTVIVARKSAYVTGIEAGEAVRLLLQWPKFHEAPLVYRHNARAVTGVVFIWPGWIATVASAIILFLSQIHDDEYGPLSSHVRNERSIQKEADPESGMMNIGSTAEKPQESV